MVAWRVMCPDRPAWGSYEWVLSWLHYAEAWSLQHWCSLDVVLQIIKSLIKLIVLKARVDIFFLIVRIFYIIFLNQFLTENFPMWNWKNQGSDEKCYNMSQKWGNPTTHVTLVRNWIAQETGIKIYTVLGAL